MVFQKRRIPEMKEKNDSTNLEAQAVRNRRTLQRAEFEEKKSELKKRRDGLIADIEKNTRLHNYVTSQKKEEFEIKGQDRAAIISDYKATLRTLSSRLQNVKAEIDSLHLERKNQVMAEKKIIWAQYYERVLAPLERQHANIEGQLEALFSGFISVVIKAQSDSVQADDLRDSDADIDDLNASGSEFGVPSNFFRIPDSEKLSKTCAANAGDVVRKLLPKINQMVDNFSREVETDWRKENPEKAKLLGGR
jgi:hypothetical protein